MLGPTFLMLSATLAALVLLVLITFSVPFVPIFYFLHSPASGGVKFGVLGFCAGLDGGGTCAPKQATFGYEYGPQIMQPLPKILILFPAAAGLTLLGLLTLLPLLFSRRRDPRWPYVAFGLLSMLAFLASAAGLGLSLWLFIGAKRRFQAEGFDADYGPSLWMSVAATAVLMLVAMNAGCGTCMGGRFGRQARHLAYTY
ncbi:hypothetical protein C8Q74DRAFT_1366422 [Fomes fomentarius]|nr:hypothetical protein C8Q74DRAFT_1366422 [Fomes fomentarius]